MTTSWGEYINQKGENTLAKRSRRAHKAHNNIVQLHSYHKKRKHVEIIPKNTMQEHYMNLIDDSKLDIICSIGPAGTGKTLLAVLSAIRAYKEGDCRKMVITRPAVSVDEQHGFLPGTLIEKMVPWTRPIFDVFEEYYSSREIETMLEENIIEIAPLAYMRGRTFKNSWIIADEMQNVNPNQMKMLLTRIGNNSRIIVTGDLAQFDRGYDANGLNDFLRRARQLPSDRIGFVQFTKEHIERHPVVSDILEIYESNTI